MEPTSFWAKLMEYGLAGIVIAILFWLVIKILIWVMAWVDKQSLQHCEERKAWKETIDKSNNINEKLVSVIERHDEKAEERGKYVREEHKQMIEVLGRINGYKN